MSPEFESESDEPLSSSDENQLVNIYDEEGAAYNRPPSDEQDLPTVSAKHILQGEEFSRDATALYPVEVTGEPVRATQIRQVKVLVYDDEATEERWQFGHTEEYEHIDSLPVTSLRGARKLLNKQEGDAYQRLSNTLKSKGGSSKKKNLIFRIPQEDKTA